jgi:hypothetical protein
LNQGETIEKQSRSRGGGGISVLLAHTCAMAMALAVAVVMAMVMLSMSSWTLQTGFSRIVVTGYSLPGVFKLTVLYGPRHSTHGSGSAAGDVSSQQGRIGYLA